MGQGVEREAQAQAQRAGRAGARNVDVGALLPPSCVAHTTWTSRESDTAEATARYLRGGEMVVRRTLFPRPLSVMAATGELPAVSEEVFVRVAPVGGGSPPTGVQMQYESDS